MGSAALEPCMKATADKRPGIRKQAIEITWRIGTEPKLLIPFYLRALKHDDAEVRGCAAAFLRTQWLSPRERFDADRPRVRAWNAEVEAQMQTIVPALIEATKDKDNSVVYSAIDSLGLLGSGAKSAVPVLLEFLEGDERQLTSAAASALGLIGPVDDRIIPALLRALKNKKDVGLRRWRPGAWAPSGRAQGHGAGPA